MVISPCMLLFFFFQETRDSKGLLVPLQVSRGGVSMCPTSYKHPVWPSCLAEISNLLVVTKDRVLTHPSPMPDSQLSFHRILKEDIEQVHPPIVSSISHLHGFSCSVRISGICTNINAWSRLIDDLLSEYVCLLCINYSGSNRTETFYR